MADLYEDLSESWANEPREYLQRAQRDIISRFQGSFRFVALRPENAETFSYEFASLLRDAGSAFASFSDAVIQGLGTKKSKWLTIKDYFDFYTGYVPDLSKKFIDVAIVEHGHEYRLQPFWEWDHQPKGPNWWCAYNDVKHSEYKNSKQGNLRNATNAIAAVEMVLRLATVSQQGGTGIFRPLGGPPWEPGQPGAEHIKRLFEP
jgi:hypothetical protein